MVTQLLAAACAALSTCGTAAPAYSFQPVLSGLDSPIGVAAPASEPDNLYVVEQSGYIVKLHNGAVAGTFLDIHTLVSTGGEQGLLSVAFHPSYATNHRLYIDYTDVNGDTRVVEYQSDGTKVLPGTRRQ